jgi:hypothetical protein
MTLASRALGSRLPWVVQVLGTVVGPDFQPEWYFGSRSMLSWTHFAALFDGRWQHWEWSVSLPASKMNDETLPAPLGLAPMPVPTPVPVADPDADATVSGPVPLVEPPANPMLPPKEGTA